MKDLPLTPLQRIRVQVDCAIDCLNRAMDGLNRFDDGSTDLRYTTVQLEIASRKIDVALIIIKIGKLVIPGEGEDADESPVAVLKDTK
jgi:hypothetical protein